MIPEDIGLASYALVAAAAFVAAVLGGVAGYGTGLLLPPILLPIVGPEAVVPVISLSALLTNGSRLVAFRAAFEPGKALLVALCAVPTCLIGAYGYTRLTGAEATLLIGIVLVGLVPVRRMAARRRFRLDTPGLAAAAGGYGVLVGGTSGSGVVLLSILLAAGLKGTAVIATDAGISLLLGIAKTAVFQTTGHLPAPAWIMALVIGVAAIPGAFLARRIAFGIPNETHVRLLDGVVLLGGAVLIAQSLGRLL